MTESKHEKYRVACSAVPGGRGSTEASGISALAGRRSLPALWRGRRSYQIGTARRLEESCSQGRVPVQWLPRAIYSDRWNHLRRFAHPAAQVAFGDSLDVFFKERNLCAPVDAKSQPWELSNRVVYGASHPLGANARAGQSDAEWNTRGGRNLRGREAARWVVCAEARREAERQASAEREQGCGAFGIAAPGVPFARIVSSA